MIEADKFFMLIITLTVKITSFMPSKYNYHNLECLKDQLQKSLLQK
jgi:hypothetical protein